MQNLCIIYAEIMQKSILNIQIMQIVCNYYQYAQYCIAYYADIMQDLCRNY